MDEAISSVETEQASQPRQESQPRIRIQYYRSIIGCPKKHKEIVRSAGFTRLNQIVERPDTPSIRGAVHKVPHLLRVVE